MPSQSDHKSINKQTLMYFIRMQLRPKYVFWRLMVILCSITTALSWDVLVPLQFKALIDFMTPLSPPLEPDVFSKIIAMFLIMIGIYCIGILGELGITLICSYTSPRITRDIENESLEKLQSFSYDFYTSSFVGSLVAQLRRFSDSYLSIEIEMIEKIPTLIVRVVATLVVLYIFSPSALVPVLIWAIFFYVTLNLMIKKKMAHDRRHSILDSKVTAVLADIIGNFISVKVFAKEREEHKRFKDTMQKRTIAMQNSWLWSTATFFMQNSMNIIVQGIVLYISLDMWGKGEMTLGTVVLIQSLLVNISKALLDFGNSLKSIYRSFAKAEEMMELHLLEPEFTDPENPIKADIKKGHIQFSNISFSYNESETVFDQFNLDIKPGERIGLVGHSGSGKSTLVKLLLRFMDPDKGEVSLDGFPIHKITQKDLRESISYVPQEPTLFHRTLKDNVSYGFPNATEKDVEEALKNAYITEMVDRLPQGLETLVGERGIKLSGGERQRVAIARAMLKQAPILVLDEATSSLDSESETYIQKAFDRLMKGRTTLVIAHRLSTIASLDRILVLDQGKIVQDGPHKQLIKQDGIYKRLFENQKNGMLVDTA